MKDCIVERDRASGRTVLRLGGNFDRTAALVLRDELAGADGAVMLDFSLVRTFDDLGVATLARVLIENEGRSVAVRGLRQHQLRLFRYIGLDVEPPPVANGDEAQITPRPARL